MLNKASTDFHTTLKTPSQITKDAGSISPDGSRLFPNAGLDIKQICSAIVNSCLVCEVKSDITPESISEYVSNRFTKKILNAYASLGIPIILVIIVPSGRQESLHAIAVCGFRTKEIEIKDFNLDPNPVWVAENIEKIYAHDDQWGPFVRIPLEGTDRLMTSAFTTGP